jgi:hypothetical protein
MPARLFLTIILCFGVICLRAQETASEKDKYYQIYGAFSLPMGSFADETEGGAQNGWGLGLQMFSGVGAKNIFMSYSLSYTQHPYKFTYGVPGYGEELIGTYNIVNLLLGFGTRTEGSSTKLYVNLMGGFSYTSLGGDLTNDKHDLDDALTFGISAGAGVIIAKNYNLGIKYYYANPTFKSNGFYENEQQKISMLHLVAGIEF